MSDFLQIMPEVFIALTLAFVVLGELTYHGEQLRLISATALVGLGGAFVQTLIAHHAGNTHAFGQALAIDGLSCFFRLFFILMAGFSVLIASFGAEIAHERRSEYFALILGATLALCLASSSTDLMLSFLALQLANLVSGFLAGYGRRSPRSTEAGTKFLIFSAIAGAFLLYGLALLFTHTHTMNLGEIHQALLRTPLPRETGLTIFMMIFLSLLFQMGAFPMYLWAPDVIEGAPSPAAAVIAVGSRAAGFVVALRLLMTVFGQPALSVEEWQVLGNLNWPDVVAAVAGLSMICGGFLAIGQKSAKRMIGCLMVVTSGQLLLGVLVMDIQGIAAVLYNLFVDLFALIGTFFVLGLFYDELHSDQLSAFPGILRRAVPECVCLIIFLLTLVGLPPTPGFVGKFILIEVAIRHGRTGLGAVAIASIALSLFAVARLFYSLIDPFDGSGKAPEPSPLVGASSRLLPRRVVLALLAAPVLLMSLFAEHVLAWAGKSLSLILW